MTLDLDDNFLQQLKNMNIVVKRAVYSRRSGLHRSHRPGQSSEFADFRPYTAGDDLRKVDWKGYARLDRFFLRLFHDEQQLTVNLLLDCSASMDWGQPNKQLFARRLFAALSYLILANGDRVTLGFLTEGNTRLFPPVHNRQQILKVWEMLESAEFNGKTRLDLSLRYWSRYETLPGVTILISDFLVASYQEALLTLLAKKQEVAVLQVLAPQEFYPDYFGQWLLADVEEGSEMSVSITPALLTRYQKRLEQQQREIARFCTNYGIKYLRVASDRSLEQIIIEDLVRTKIISR